MLCQLRSKASDNAQTQRVASPITGGKAGKVFQATWMSLSDEC